MQIGQMNILFDILIDYIAADAVTNMPDDVYELIQALLNYFNAILRSKLNLFGIKKISSAELQDIIAVLRKLLSKLAKSIDLTTLEAKRFNTILIKFCLMIYGNHQFQDLLQSDENGRNLQHQFLEEILKALLQLFLKRSVRCDLNDDHFIQLLYDLMNPRKNQNGNGPDFLQFLMYVNIVFICCCLKSVNF